MYLSQAHSSLLRSLAAALLLAGLVPCLVPSHALAQSTQAMQLPLMGGSAPGASVQQSAVPAMAASVNTLNTAIRPVGNYSGSAADPNPPQGTLRLTLAEALRRGLAFNLGTVGANAAARQAEAGRLAARSALLPEVGAALSENAMKADLAAEGFSASLFGGAGSFKLPSTVGPFQFYDLRGTLHQSALDLTAFHNERAASQSARSAKLGALQSREEVVLAVTGSYLQLMAAQALVEAQQKEVDYAQASYQQAKAEMEEGNKAPIDANRSLVELQTEQQRLRSQQGDVTKQKLQLARMIGLPLTVALELEEKLSVQPAATQPDEELVRRAWAARQDLKAAEAGLQAAIESRKAAAAERLPAVSVDGYYGIEGVHPDQGNGIFQATAGVKIPLFTGGRVHAETAQADAVVSERRAELENQRGSVELEVRSALVDLAVANQQVQTAQSNRQLAQATLEQSADRFRVGVADSVEVVSSQQALAAADHDFVSSVFAQNLARLELAHAMGEAENEIPNLLKGSN